MDINRCMQNIKFIINEKFNSNLTYPLINFKIKNIYIQFPKNHIYHLKTITIEWCHVYSATFSYTFFFFISFNIIFYLLHCNSIFLMQGVVFFFISIFFLTIHFDLHISTCICGSSL